MTWNATLILMLEEHRLWLATGGKEGHRANLRGANLRCASLCWGEASEQNYPAKIAGAKLPSDCDWVLFGPVDFTEVDLRGVDLSNAYIVGAKGVKRVDTWTVLPVKGV